MLVGVWIGLGVLVLAFVGGLAFAALRALQAFRALRQTGHGLSAGLQQVADDTEQIATKLEALAAGSTRLAAALARLRVSQARLTVLLDALGDVRIGIGRITGLVPRKG